MGESKSGLAGSTDRWTSRGEAKRFIPGSFDSGFYVPMELYILETKYYNEWFGGYLEWIEVGLGLVLCTQP